MCVFICVDGFSHGYVGESVACLFTPGSIYVLTASGMHCHQSSEHFVSLFSCFRYSAAFAAPPAEILASETILGLSCEVTVLFYFIYH